MECQVTETETMTSDPNDTSCLPVLHSITISMPPEDLEQTNSEIPALLESNIKASIDSKVDSEKKYHTYEKSITYEAVDSFCPKPSPRLKKNRRAITSAENQNRNDVPLNNLYDYKTKDYETQNLQNNIKLENEYDMEKESIKDLVRSQLKELKQIKDDLLKLSDEGNKHKATTKETDSNKIVEKLKKDLKKKSCLLKDAQLYISKLEKRKDFKTEINLLKDKIDSLEDERRYLKKAKGELEDDLEELRLEKENIEKRVTITEKKYREKEEENLTLTQQLCENEESIENIMTKYKSAIGSISKYQSIIDNQTDELGKLSLQNRKLEDNLENCIRKAFKKTGANKVQVCEEKKKFG